ncbi:DUF190 domain-containing protein [Pseudothermotoga sp. U03pept]|uniref:DUF190 domain-containing protein n=1 Tax=Pseudothermotoga sp. U03pept TaxID=3447012 RepID=UPI003F055E65
MQQVVGTFLRIYVKENQKCEAFRKKPLNQVIAEMALKMEITDFVEYKAFEGYIFDRRIHTMAREIIDHELPIIIELFTTNEKAQRFLETIAPHLKNTIVLVFRDTLGYLFE